MAEVSCEMRNCFEIFVVYFSSRSSSLDYFLFHNFRSFLNINVEDVWMPVIYDYQTLFLNIPAWSSIPSLIVNHYYFLINIIEL